MPRPVQKTALTPSGLLVAHDDSAPGTYGLDVTVSREYLLLQASTTCPTARVTIKGLSRNTPTKIPLAKPISTPIPRQAGIASQRRWSELAPIPTIRLPPMEITPGVERSMPACITTSICPSAATARTVVYGRTYDQDVLPKADGASNAATTPSAAVASQTGRKRAPRRAFA